MTTIPRGQHLFLNFQGRSRTALSASVSVLMRDPDAQPGVQIQNVSEYVSKTLRRPWNRNLNAVVIRQEFRIERDNLARFICSELGKKLHQNAEAFTWEWL